MGPVAAVCMHVKCSYVASAFSCDNENVCAELLIYLSTFLPYVGWCMLFEMI